MLYLWKLLLKTSYRRQLHMQLSSLSVLEARLTLICPLNIPSYSHCIWIGFYFILLFISKPTAYKIKWEFVQNMFMSFTYFTLIKNRLSWKYLRPWRTPNTSSLISFLLVLTGYCQISLRNVIDKSPDIYYKQQQQQHRNKTAIPETH